jgi:hypothetical protein
VSRPTKLVLVVFLVHPIDLSRAVSSRTKRFLEFRGSPTAHVKTVDHENVRSEFARREELCAPFPLRRSAEGAFFVRSRSIKIAPEYSIGPIVHLGAARE